MDIAVTEDYESLSKQAAAKVAALIRKRNEQGRATVLGLPTGNTPVGMYQELVRLHEEEGLDFSRVITFNLDEYWPIAPNHIQSYHRYMHHHLFDHININPANIHIPDGQVSENDLPRYCIDYEQAIAAAGGIDLMVVGIGADGHIGFNEHKKDDPDYSIQSRTRRVDLSARTIADNQPPSHQAITMGMASIMQAKAILLLANGDKKKPIIEQIVAAPMNLDVPANLLRMHKNCEMLLDKAAAAGIQAQLDSPQSSRL